MLAKRLGATGLESDVWLTADGHPMLDHDGVVKTGVRRRMIRDVNRSALPSHVPGLDDLYASVGTALPLSLDLKDPEAIGRTIAVARAAGSEAVEKLWLCDWNWERLAADRSRLPVGPRCAGRHCENDAACDLKRHRLSRRISFG